jgi:hypothetical protein
VVLSTDAFPAAFFVEFDVTEEVLVGDEFENLVEVFFG